MLYLRYYLNFILLLIASSSWAALVKKDIQAAAHVVVGSLDGAKVVPDHSTVLIGGEGTPDADETLLLPTYDPRLHDKQTLLLQGVCPVNRLFWGRKGGLDQSQASNCACDAKIGFWEFAFQAERSVRYGGHLVIVGCWGSLDFIKVTSHFDQPVFSVRSSVQKVQFLLDQGTESAGMRLASPERDDAIEALTKVGFALLTSKLETQGVLSKIHSLFSTHTQECAGTQRQILEARTVLIFRKISGLDSIDRLGRHYQKIITDEERKAKWEKEKEKFVGKMVAKYKEVRFKMKQRHLERKSGRMQKYYPLEN